MDTESKKKEITLQKKSNNVQQENYLHTTPDSDAVSEGNSRGFDRSVDRVSSTSGRGQVAMQFKEPSKNTDFQRENGARKQRQTNSAGLPDNLKNGIENLSGYSMDDVKVHYNSSKPAQFWAHAYAQGTDIHLAAGQEKHLPHEAWHVVQQKQGRVKPTMQLKGKVNANDNAEMEKEADIMGARAQGLTCNQTHEEGRAQHAKYQVIDKPLVQRRLAPPEVDSGWQENLHALFVKCQNLPYIQALEKSTENLKEKDLIKMFETAVEYMYSSDTGKRIIDKIEAWGSEVKVIVGSDQPTKAGISPGSNAAVTIPWNPFIFFGVWTADERNNITGGAMSPAAILLHEFGHVCQHIDDLEGYAELNANHSPIHKVLSQYNYENRNKDLMTPWFIEHHNMARNERPFNEEKGEPVRNKYASSYAQLDVEAGITTQPNETVDRAFQARASYIAKHGWINAVAFHTDIERADKPDARLNDENYKWNIGSTSTNPVLRVNSVFDFIEIITERITNSTSSREVSDAVSDLQNYLKDTKGLELPKLIKFIVKDTIELLITQIEKGSKLPNSKVPGWKIKAVKKALVEWTFAKSSF